MARFLCLPVLLLIASSVFVAAQTIPTPAPRDLNVEQEAIAPTRNKPAPSDKRSDGEPAENKDNRIYQSACPVVLQGRVSATRLPPISEGRCGERSPLEVTAVAGIPLSSSAILNCRTATAMADWMQVANEEAVREIGFGISKVVTSTSYQCRRRNNALTGKISEHGFANAVDILGLEFSNGDTLSLIKDWSFQGSRKSEGDDDEDNTDASSNLTDSETPMSRGAAYLRAARDLACEHFTTVLSPDSNPLHADHFHFDLGCHGKDCTYKICE